MRTADTTKYLKIKRPNFNSFKDDSEDTERYVTLTLTERQANQLSRMMTAASNGEYNAYYFDDNYMEGSGNDPYGYKETARRIMQALAPHRTGADIILYDDKDY